MEANEKQCPHCAETIKAAAVVCKHCHKRVAPRWWLLAIPAVALAAVGAVALKGATTPNEVALARKQLQYCEQTTRQAGLDASGCKRRYEERLRLLGYDSYL